MVVENGQGMAARLVQHRNPALVVHLPEQVRRFHLEPLHRSGAADRRADPIVPAENLMDRRYRRRFHPRTAKASLDLAGPPGRVFIAYRKHADLHLGGATKWTVLRLARAIGKLSIARLIARHPPVAGIGTDPEPPAQLAPVYPILHRQQHKLTSLIHHRHPSPRHGTPPKQPIPCNDDVSGISPNTRQGCPRNKHLSRPSCLARHRIDSRDRRDNLAALSGSPGDDEAEQRIVMKLASYIADGKPAFGAVVGDGVVTLSGRSRHATLREVLA